MSGGNFGGECPWGKCPGGRGGGGKCLRTFVIDLIASSFNLSFRNAFWYYLRTTTYFTAFRMKFYHCFV